MGRGKVRGVGGPRWGGGARIGPAAGFLAGTPAAPLPPPLPAPLPLPMQQPPPAPTSAAGPGSGPLAIGKGASQPTPMMHPAPAPMWDETTLSAPKGALRNKFEGEMAKKASLGAAASGSATLAAYEYPPLALPLLPVQTGLARAASPAPPLLGGGKHHSYTHEGVTYFREEGSLADLPPLPGR